MRDDASDGSRMPGEDARAAQRCALGRSRVWPASRKLLPLLLLGAIVLPWFSIPKPAGEPAPMRLARGVPGVQTLGFAFSPDGETIATIDTNGRVALREVTDGWSITRFLDYRGCAWSAAFAPDGQLLAIGGIEPDIILYDLRSHDAGHPLGMPIREVKALVFSPDGHILAATSSLHDWIILWDLATGREQMTLHGHASPAISIAFAPDGRSLASGGRDDGMVIVWDLAAGRPRRLLSGNPGPILSLTSSPDGTLLAWVNCYEHRVRLWDLKAGRLDRLIGSHSSAPNAVAFSPDGRMLAITGSDGGMGLWSVATGRQLDRFEAQGEPLRGVAFSPDGKTLAATGNDDGVRLWKLVDLPRAQAKP
jgi:WD40 repeat protein